VCVSQVDPLHFWLDVVVVVLDISLSVRYSIFYVTLLVSGCMLCLVRYLFIINTSSIDCLVRLASEMSY